MTARFSPSCAAAVRIFLCLCLSVLLLPVAAFPGGAFAQSKPRKTRVDYRSVTLEFDAALAKEYLAETAEAVPLENPTDKPDGVAPAHIVISFRDSYARTLHRVPSPLSGEPKIYIFPTSDPSDPRFDQKFPMTRWATAGLRKFLERRGGAVATSIPFLPWADEGQLFIGRKRLLRFRNGRGVLFLTQYGQEPALLNNGELVYTFQGLTDDNAWYVSATFPVAAQGLPASPGPGSEAVMRGPYGDYVRKTTERLNRLSVRRFTPGLTQLEEIIRSLKVTPR